MDRQDLLVQDGSREVAKPPPGQAQAPESRVASRECRPAAWGAAEGAAQDELTRRRQHSSSSFIKTSASSTQLNPTQPTQEPRPGSIYELSVMVVFAVTTYLCRLILEI